jgi:hypothetical protein
LPGADGAEVLSGEVYDFDELDQVDQGIVPVREDVKVIAVDGTRTQAAWDVERLMWMKGIHSCQWIVLLVTVVIILNQIMMHGSYAKFCHPWQLPFCQFCRQNRPKTVLPPTLPCW